MIASSAPARILSAIFVITGDAGALIVSDGPLNVRPAASRRITLRLPAPSSGTVMMCVSAAGVATSIASSPPIEIASSFLKCEPVIVTRSPGRALAGVNVSIIARTSSALTNMNACPSDDVSLPHRAVTFTSLATCFGATTMRSGVCVVLIVRAGVSPNHASHPDMRTLSPLMRTSVPPASVPEDGASCVSRSGAAV